VSRVETEQALLPLHHQRVPSRNRLLEPRGLDPSHWGARRCSAVPLVFDWKGLSAVSLHMAGDCACIVRAFSPLSDARAVTLSPPPPVHTKLPCIASRMATPQQQDLEYNRMFPNACVLPDGLSLMTVLIVAHYSSPGPSASQNPGRGCVNFFTVVLLLKSHPRTRTVLKSPNPTEDYPTNASR
jgi:hypothetical protein